MPIHPSLGLTQGVTLGLIIFLVNVTLGVQLDIFIVMMLHCIRVLQSHLFQIVVLNMRVCGECLLVLSMEEHQITFPPCYIIRFNFP